MDNNTNTKFDLSHFFINLLILIFVEAVLWYFFVPAFNVFTIGFWIIFVFPLIYTLWYTPFRNKLFPLLLVLLAILFVSGFIQGFSFLNSSKSHSEIAKVNNDGDFAEYAIVVDSPTSLPIVDKESAIDLGTKLVNSTEEYANIYTLDSESTLISYNENYYRIFSLDFAELPNFDGIPGYVLVNVYTGEAKLVKLEAENTIKYSPNAILGKDLFRHLRINYPFSIFGDENFEIDDNGHPYYIVPILKIKSMIFGGRYVKNVLVVDAITGEIKEYTLSNLPKWVDNVYNVERIMSETKWHLLYNTYDWDWFFGPFNPPETRYYDNIPEYYEFAKDGHVYVYAGVRLGNSTPNNIAFILGDLRNGEITYYSDYGISEYSAQVAAYNLFPEAQYLTSRVMLVNIEGYPAYYLTLKNHLNNVEQYAFVNKNNPVFFVADETVEKALISYYQVIGKKYPYSFEHDGTEVSNSEPGVHDDDKTAKDTTLTNTESTDVETSINGTVSTVNSGSIDGNTVFLFTLEGREEFFTSYLSINVEQLVKLVPSAKIAITYKVIDGTNIVSTIKFE